MQFIDVVHLFLFYFMCKNFLTIFDSSLLVLMNIIMKNRFCSSIVRFLTPLFVAHSNIHLSYSPLLLFVTRVIKFYPCAISSIIIFVDYTSSGHRLTCFLVFFPHFPILSHFHDVFLLQHITTHPCQPVTSQFPIFFYITY
jgi:hypothetical protein